MNWFITVIDHLAWALLFIIQKKVLSDEPAGTIFRLIFFALCLIDIAV